MLPSYDDNSYSAFLCSLILHIALAYLFFYGLPSSFHKTPLQEEVIIFEMLPVADIVNVPTQKKQSVIDSKEEERKKVTENKVLDKPTAEKEEKILPTTNPPESVQPEVIKPLVKEEVIPEKPVPDAIVEKIAPVVLPEPEKKIVEKIEPKPEEKKPVKAAETKEKKKSPPLADLDSLLKNLEKSSAGKVDKSSKQAKAEKSLSDKEMMGLFDEESSLSVTESSIIKAQIQKHWHPPLGGQNASRIKIVYYIEFSSDGSVQKAALESKNCAGTPSSLCNAFVESAERAIWQASPIVNLPPERYNVWKSLNFNFDPSDLLR